MNSSSYIKIKIWDRVEISRILYRTKWKWWL